MKQDSTTIIQFKQTNFIVKAAITVHVFLLGHVTMVENTKKLLLENQNKTTVNNWGALRLETEKIVNKKY